MMKCTICFEASTGIRPGDYFVSTQNGHVFHHICVLEFVAAGSSACPICDEDLRNHTFVRLNSQGVPAPTRPPKPGRIPNVTHSTTPTSTGTAMRWNDPWRLDEGRSGISQHGQIPAQTSPSFTVQPDYVFKIVVLGDYNVGKSSLLQRYADDRFDPIIQTTTGCDLRVKVISIAGKVVRLNMWDTAGQERHRAIVDLYLRKADGIIFCFDITDAASFLSLETWLSFSQRSLPSDTLKIIVGTKSDLWSQRVVSSHQVQNLAESWNAQYIYTSAKDAINVEVVFRSLSALILENRIPSTYNNASSLPSAPLLQEFQPPTSKKGETIKLYNPLKTSKKQKKTNEFDKCCN